MYWTITRDYLYEEDEKAGHDPKNRSDVGVAGPRDGIRTTLLPVRFLMGDDDGITYYEGRATDEDAAQMAFDGFGVPNAGCAWIKLWQNGKGGGWKPFIS